MTTGRSRRHRLVVAGIAAWMLAGLVVGELPDPPFDAVRFVVRLVLGALVAWFLVCCATRSFFQRRGD